MKRVLFLAVAFRLVLSLPVMADTCDDPLCMDGAGEEYVQDTMDSTIQDGGGVSWTYDDEAGTITPSVTWPDPCGLDGVDCVALADDYYLRYDAATDTWIPEALPEVDLSPYAKLDGSNGPTTGTWTFEKMLLPFSADLVPTVAFGDGDTGLVESGADDLLYVVTGGNADWAFDSTGFGHATSGSRPFLRNVNASRTVPTVLARATDTDTGIGSGALDSMALIAGGVYGLGVVEVGGSSFVVVPASDYGTFGTHYLGLSHDGTNGYISSLAGDLWLGPASGIVGIGGAVRLGTTSDTTAGNVRWTGTDFEGYTGSAWESFTLAEADIDTLTSSPSEYTLTLTDDGTDMMLQGDHNLTFDLTSGDFTFEDDVRGPSSGCSAATTLTLDGSPAAYGGTDFATDLIGVCDPGDTALYITVEDVGGGFTFVCESAPVSGDILSNLGTDFVFGTDDLRLCLFDFGGGAGVSLLIPSSDMCQTFSDNTFGDTTPLSGPPASFDDDEYFEYNATTCTYDFAPDVGLSIVTGWTDPPTVTTDATPTRYWSIASDGTFLGQQARFDSLFAGNLYSLYGGGATIGVVDQEVITDNHSASMFGVSSVKAVQSSTGTPFSGFGIGTVSYTNSGNSTDDFTSAYPFGGIVGGYWQGEHTGSGTMAFLKGGEFRITTYGADAGPVTYGVALLPFITQESGATSVFGDADSILIAEYPGEPGEVTNDRVGLHIDDLTIGGVNYGVKIEEFTNSGGNDWGIWSDFRIGLGDDVPVYFGTDLDGSIYYDEAGDDALHIVSPLIALTGDLTLSGGTTYSDGTDASIIKHVQEPGLGGRLTIGLDETARTMVICDAGDMNRDFVLGAETNPRIYIATASGSTSAGTSLGWRSLVFGDIGQIWAKFGLSFYQTADRTSGNVFSFLSSNPAYEITDTDAQQSWLFVEPKVNQSGTASYNGIKVTATETGLGDGSTGIGGENNLFVLGTVSDDDMFRVANDGDVYMDGTLTTASGQPWDLGAATNSSTITPDSYVTVQIGSATYRLDAYKVP